MDNKLPIQYRRAFKDADIRGIAGPELDDDLAYRIAQAFVKEVKAKEVVVGYDMRVSSLSLVEAFRAGTRDAGVDVIDIGLCSSPMLYFASGFYDVPGVMITASHSPADHNGFKLVERGAIPLTKNTGLDAILHAVSSGYTKHATRTGGWKKRDVRKQYIQYALKGMRRNVADGMRIAADAGNGMASLVLPLLQEKMSADFETLFTDMDGRFPNRGSDPTLSKNQTHLRKLLKSASFDFGIAFDGDADRIAFLDENGRYVNCAVIGAVIAEQLLARAPGSSFVFTNLTSRVYEETIAHAGGTPVRARVGHAFLKEKMRETDAVFGCEHSGHFFFRDFYFTDSVVMTLRFVIEGYAEAKKASLTFSEWVKPYQKYSQLEDVVVSVSDKRAALAAMRVCIKQNYPEAKIRNFDGLYVELSDVWGAVKPSVTEHAIKIMFEGRTKQAAKTVQEQLVAELKHIAKHSQK